MPKIKDMQILLDPEDYKTFGEKYGSITKNGYVMVDRRLLHRIILNVKDRKVQVDHINHNKLDNRKENLRLCSAQENNRHRGDFKNNKLRVKGVSKAPGNRTKNPYRARITINRKTIHLGYFPTIEAANKAWCQAYFEVFKEYARK